MGLKNQQDEELSVCVSVYVRNDPDGHYKLGAARLVVVVVVVAAAAGRGTLPLGALPGSQEKVPWTAQNSSRRVKRLLIHDGDDGP